MSFRFATYGQIFRVPLLCVTLLLGVGCGYDSHREPPFVLAEEHCTTSTRELHRLVEMGQFGEDVVVMGRVTANDIAGNFHKSIVVEDPTGAVELRLDSYDLESLYPVGSTVVADLSGLAGNYYDGVLQVGRVVYEWDDYRVEPVATRREIAERVRVAREVEALEPEVVTMEQLGSEMCGRLVRIEGLRCAEEQTDGRLQWGESNYGSSCDRLFVAASGEHLLVRTSIYADFASALVPEREVAITGVLYLDRYEGEEVYVLKMRDLGDVE